MKNIEALKSDINAMKGISQLLLFTGISMFLCNLLLPIIDDNGMLTHKLTATIPLQMVNAISIGLILVGGNYYWYIRKIMKRLNHEEKINSANLSKND